MANANGVGAETLPTAPKQYSQEYQNQLIGILNRILRRLNTSVNADPTSGFIIGPYDPPPASVGSNGDVYFSQKTLTLYGPKAGGAWPSSGAKLGAS